MTEPTIYNDGRCSYPLTPFVRCRRPDAGEGYCTNHQGMIGASERNPGFATQFPDSKYAKRASRRQRAR